jgi:O-antigen/teichoic acid export membrane protein
VRSPVARNTAWNLLGALLPVPVALTCIPLLVKALGVERFGVLGLAWMALGYFGMFDFGLAQSTTRFVSSSVAKGGSGGVRALVRASVLLHAALGLAGGLLFALLAPWLAASVFALPPELVGETRIALYWLAASVPAIVLTAAVRGALEGLQRFDIVNLIRVPASIINYAGPLIALQFGSGLPLVVAVIVAARFVVLAAYASACLAHLPPAQGGARLGRAGLLRLAAYGGWLTASNLVSPLILAADRFVIAATVSVAAVAFYVTPYEIITRGWILSASLMGAMFPVFSSLATSDPGAIRGACRSAEVWLLAAAAPAVALLLGCADLLLDWWLGAAFRDNSATVARLLALGLLVNIVAQVPLTALNAAGKADVTAKIAALELPLYIAAMWYGAKRYGIDGVAAVWALRAGVDALVLFVAAHRVLPKQTRPDSAGRLGVGGALMLCAFLAAAWLMASVLRDQLAVRLALLAGVVAALSFWQWRVLLTQSDRHGFASLCRRLLAIRTQ